MPKKTLSKNSSPKRSVKGSAKPVANESKTTNDENDLLEVFGLLHKFRAQAYAQTSQIPHLVDGQSPFDIPPQLNPIFLT